MSDTTQKTIEGWIDQASRQLQSAKEYSTSVYRCVDAIQSAQQCIELTVKAVLTMLRVTYPKAHEWAADKEPFAAIARQIKQKGLISKLEAQHLNNSVPLPRILLLMSLWGHLYLISKYGFEVEFLASAQQLFKPEEAKLAVQHAEECYQAANSLRYLDSQKLEAIISE